MTELGNKNYKNVLIQNLQKAKMTLKSLSPDSDLLSNILEVVSDLRQTAHMLEDVVQELTKNVDTKTKRPEKKTKHGSKDVLKDNHHYLTCNVCTMKYKNVSDLERHIKSVHEDHEKFECGKCDNSFVTKWRLEKHVKMPYKRMLLLQK